MKRGSLYCLLLIVSVLVIPVAAKQSPVFWVPDNVPPVHTPVQPLPFSHKLHVNSGLVCMNCHVNADPGTEMGLPQTNDCMQCHLVIASDRPAIIDLQAYSESDQPIPWQRVYEIASTVSWSHRVHLGADLQCETCHGEVREMEVVSEAKATRAMGTCIGCHEAQGAPAECVTCHAWPTDKMLGVD